MRDLEVKKANIIFILPFSFENCDPDPHRYRKTPLFPDTYSNIDLLEKTPPDNSTLKQFFLEDLDAYAPDFLKEHDMLRSCFCSEHCIKIGQDVMPANTKVLLSVREEQNGLVVFVLQFEKNFLFQDFMRTVKNLKDPSLYSLVCRDEYNVELLLSSYFREVFGAKDPKFHIGAMYPYINLPSVDGNIPNVDRFVEDNLLAVYGLLHQDYTGWSRTKTETARATLDQNLSRRQEYALYVSPVATLEIDDETRMRTVKKWADEQGVALCDISLKLMVEKVISLEMLVLQKFILIQIDNQINKTVLREHGQLKQSKHMIVKDLCDFYNIRMQNEQHVSGVEWFEYGKTRMGIDTLYRSLTERMALLESVVKEEEQEHQDAITRILTFVSFFLGNESLAALSVWLFSIFPLPTGISWMIVFGVLLVFNVSMALVLLKTRRKK